jgi:hypothetical protein
MERSDAVRKRLTRTPVIGSLLVFLYRFKIGLPSVTRAVSAFLGWLVTSREYTNYTYDLEPRNKLHLAAFVAHVVERPYSEVLGYIQEIEEDVDLKAAIAAGVSMQRSGANTVMPYGRRLGWYALVRALKPRIVVETGVDKGLGACVLAAALRKNASEGAEGRYVGTDINPEAGYLLRGEYARYGEILYGDSIESLGMLTDQIDIFINDSDHSAEYEAREYAAVEDKLSDDAIIIGDNAHVTDCLIRFALETNRRFLFFREEPAGHWYGGAGIGVAFRQ